MPEPEPSGRRKIVCSHVVGLFWRRIESGLEGASDGTLWGLYDRLLVRGILGEDSDEAVLAEGLEERDLVGLTPWRVVL